MPESQPEQVDRFPRSRSTPPCPHHSTEGGATASSLPSQRGHLRVPPERLVPRAHGGTARNRRRAGANGRGGSSWCPTRSPPNRRGPPEPQGLGPPQRAAAAPTRGRRAAGERAQSGGGGRARTDVPAAPQPPRRPAPAAARPPGPRCPPAARHGVMDHLQARGVSGLLPRAPSFPSFSARGPRPRPPGAAAINTRRPLILAGTVAAEVAGERAQDATAALPAPGTAGRGRERGGALTLCSPGWWDLRRPRTGAPRGHASPLWEKCWLGSPVAAPRGPPGFGQTKMTERAQMSLGRCLEGSARGRVERWRRGSQWG